MTAEMLSGPGGADPGGGWVPTAAASWGGRPVARTVAEVGVRQRAALRGTVAWCRWARLGLEVGLDDGTGTLTLRWLGRRAVPGVAPGAVLVVEGTVGDEHGRLVVLNPLYEVSTSL